MSGITILRLSDRVPVWRVTIDGGTCTVAATTLAGVPITQAQAEAVVRDDLRSLARYPAVVCQGAEARRGDCSYPVPEDHLPELMPRRRARREPTLLDHLDAIQIDLGGAE